MVAIKLLLIALFLQDHSLPKIKKNQTPLPKKLKTNTLTFTKNQEKSQEHSLTLSKEIKAHDNP